MAKPLVALQQGCNRGLCPGPPQVTPGNTGSSVVFLGWYSSPWQQVQSDLVTVTMTNLTADCSDATVVTSPPASLSFSLPLPRSTSSLSFQTSDSVFSGSLSQCSVSCGGGVQTRSIQCLRHGRPAAGCLAHQRPVSSRACNTHFCPAAPPASSHRPGWNTNPGATSKGTECRGLWGGLGVNLLLTKNECQTKSLTVCVF